MACQSYTLAGLEQGCRGDNLSGVKYILFANKSDVTDIAVDSGTSIVTGITMASGATFAKYTMSKETGSLTSEFTSNDTNGVAYWTTSLTMQFNKMDTGKRLEIIALSNNELVGICADGNGKFWLCGYDMPVTLDSGTIQTGAARDDGNFMTVTLTDVSQLPPYEVDADIIADLL